MNYNVQVVYSILVIFIKTVASRSQKTNAILKKKTKPLRIVMRMCIHVMRNNFAFHVIYLTVINKANINNSNEYIFQRKSEIAYRRKEESPK